MVHAPQRMPTASISLRGVNPAAVCVRLITRRPPATRPPARTHDRHHDSQGAPPMPLMTTKPMFDLAYDGGFAVGAFNVNNMEITQAIISACAAERSPLILQISKGARKYANMRYLKHMIEAAVEEHP